MLMFKATTQSKLLFARAPVLDTKFCHRLIRTIGAASTVLLKNTGQTLPLNAPKSIALIGSDAGPNPDGPNRLTLIMYCHGIPAYRRSAGVSIVVATLEPLL